MSEKKSRVWRILSELRSHILWDAIKYVWPFMIPAAYVVLQKARHLDWDWVVFGGLFVVGLAIFLVDKLAKPRLVQSTPTQQFQEVPVTVRSSVVEVVPVAEPRVFVRGSITPDYLVGLFENQTAIQAERLFEPFREKWIRIEGIVDDISALPHSIHLLAKQTNGRAGLSLSFALEWHDRLSIIPLGERIKVEGRIHAVHGGGLFLQDCQLLD